MLQIMDKYAAWKIMTFFLDHPTGSFYVREVAERLKISSSTASRIMEELQKEGALSGKTRAKALFYSLTNGPAVRALKRFRILTKLDDLGMVERFLTVDEDLSSLALYGSYASGEYDEKSDLDLICITEKEESEFAGAVRELESMLRIETSAKILTPSKWRRMAKEDQLFYDSVIRNYILLHGIPLMME